MFTTIFVEPFVYLLNIFATLFQGSYGISIIVVTLIVRFCLLPLFYKQHNQQKDMQAKMLRIKPELDVLQQKMKDTKHKDQQLEIQQQMASVYREHKVNPLAMGCLPIMIQFPILIGFYYAISHSQEIASQSFLWFDLGSSSFTMALIAGVIYLAQFKISQNLNQTSNQPVNPTLNMVGFLSPIMMFFFSLNIPAALPLYWAIGGFFMIGQTILFKWLEKTKANMKDQADVTHKAKRKPI